MVASISARGNAAAAVSYYAHLRQDSYYSREGEPPGRWAGEGAARLSLNGPVIQSEFEKALSGIDPKTGERLVQYGGQSRNHSAGWDMTLSAPKSVSVLWALSNETARKEIEQAHRAAALSATRELEATSAWARRGKGGATQEQTAGLLVAQFDHHTSRELDPQLHTHCFVFNMAPRRDGSWGAIVSRELYKAQKDIGAVYRSELAQGLERLGYRLDRQPDGFRVATIPRSVERAFSKRRQAIEQAVEAHGYKTPKGMELAALRTRRAKQDVKSEHLFRAWQTEAAGIGFTLSQNREPARSQSVVSERLTSIPVARRSPAARTSQASTGSNVAQALTHQLGQLGRAISQPSAMLGLKPRLRVREQERE